MGNVAVDKIYRRTHGYPISVAAAGNLTTSTWLDLRGCDRLEILALMGVGDGTTAITFLQATSSAGAGSKACTGQLADAAVDTALVKFSATADGTAVEHDWILASGDLDWAAGFCFVKAVATVTGGTGTVLSTTLRAGPAPYQAVTN